jgi:hypothetical protein
MQRPILRQNTVQSSCAGECGARGLPIQVPGSGGKNIRKLNIYLDAGKAVDIMDIRHKYIHTRTKKP